MKELVERLKQRYKEADATEILTSIAGEYGKQVAFSTSFGAEDQVITQMLSKAGSGVTIFTLDTGRMFQETYDTMDVTAKKYGISIALVFPDRDQVEQMVDAKGINLFYDSVENRRQCCSIRKTIPLKRALEGHLVWVTGLRRDQSVTRHSEAMISWSDEYNLIKFNPLIDWSEEKVWDYIRTHKVPYNPLHDKNYPSIGCQPCTRAVLPGEPVRAGRWWWEHPENKECGLHK